VVALRRVACGSLFFTVIVRRRSLIGETTTTTQQLLPVLSRWCFRSAAAQDTAVACALWAHVAYLFRHVSSSSQSASATDEVDAECVARLVAAHVFLNANYDLDIDAAAADGPTSRGMHADQEQQKQRQRRDSSSSSSHWVPDGLGLPVTEVLDLFQATRGVVLAWLEREPGQRGDVMEAALRVVTGTNGSSSSSSSSSSAAAAAAAASGDAHHLHGWGASSQHMLLRQPQPFSATSGGGGGAGAFDVRKWNRLPRRGCAGRYVPDTMGGSEADGRPPMAIAAAAAAAAARGGGGGVSYADYLRAINALTMDTEINVQVHEVLGRVAPRALSVWRWTPRPRDAHK
jgi:hypothetical protein